MQSIRKRTGLIIKLVFLCLAVYMVFSFIQLQVELASKQEKLAALEAEYEQQILKNEELQGVLDLGADEEYYERMARERLNYAYPDEQVFIDISGS